MNKPVKITLLILGIAALWGVLASINSGIIGLGVILSMLAVLDIATGEFSGGKKMVWLTISIAALLFAVIGIGSVYIIPTAAAGENPVRILSAVVSIILPMAYFLIGRRQRIPNRSASPPKG